MNKQPTDTEPVLIYFASIPQKVLWDLELSGQISDGHWENAKPSDHYMPWCLAQTFVDPQNPRIEFAVEPRRRNYNFTDKGLLEVVGKRMMVYVRLALTYGWRAAKLIKASALLDLQGNVRFPGMMVLERDVDRAKEVLDEIGTTPVHLVKVAANEAIYDEKALKKDLNFMKKLIKGTI